MRQPNGTERAVTAATVQANIDAREPVADAPRGKGWDVALSTIAAMVAALLMPLEDADLPMHLATGAWMLDHGWVPVTEPFAWTRIGAPFYAYSWLPEVLYEAARRVAGLWGVSVVHAMATAGAVLAVWDLGRVAQWSLWATRLAVSLHFLVWMLVQSATRPQLMLAIAIPLAWAAAYRLRSAASPWRGYLLAGAAAALAVNSHLLFPLTMVPIVALLAATTRRWERVVGFVAATALGWACTPNVLYVMDMMRLNFGYNALFNAGSPIVEHEGGFTFFTHAEIGTRLVVASLLLLPLLGFFGRMTQRARWWYGLAWLAGLGLFGLAIRGLLLWWLLALPLFALALASIPLPTLSLTKKLVVGSWVVALLALTGQAAKARRLMPRALSVPHPESVAVAPAVRWMTCALAGTSPQPGARWTARGTTIFNYGSLLTWTVPTTSWSMDGRTIFPDSVAVAEAPQSLLHGTIVHPPWRSSDVVVLPKGHLTGELLNADSAWLRIPLAALDSVPSARLWVRRAWLARVPRAAACGTGVEPR